jgi:hypothetical protein
MLEESYRILVRMDRPFKNNILPLIDRKAATENKTRADVIRDILYSHYDYHPEVRSSDQLEQDYNTEATHNHDGYYCDVSSKTPSLFVCVDSEFQDLFIVDCSKYTGGQKNPVIRYWTHSRDILIDYFRKAVPA